MTDKERILSLLCDYYDGRATAAATEELKRYFSATPDVDDDLRADAAIFRALAAHDADGGGDMPADLHERLLDATVRSASARRLRFAAVLRYAAAVAAVALVAAAALWIVPSRPSAGRLTAELVEMADTLAIPRQQAAPARELLADAEPGGTQAEEAPQPRKAAPAVARTAVELTDSAEVVAVTADVMQRLSRALGSGGRAIAKAENAVAAVRSPLDALSLIKKN